MNKKQTFTSHQSTKRMLGTKLETIKYITNFTIKWIKTIASKNNLMLVYLYWMREDYKNHCS